MMNAETLKEIERRVAYLKSHRDRLVIDGDVHLTDPEAWPQALRRRAAGSPDYFHGRPIDADQLLDEMDAAAVDMALAWQNPAATAYTGDPDRDYEALLAANRYVHRAARAHPTRILPAGWTDPKALGVDGAVRLVDHCVDRLGFAIVKMNPAQNEYPIDTESVVAVVDRIVGRGAIPAFHYGADTPFTPAEGLEAIAERHADHPLIAVHMGGGGASYLDAEPLYAASRALGLRRPNVRFVFSARRDTHTESDLIAYQHAGQPFCRHLICGSDAPYGRISFHFAGYRAMLDHLRQPERHHDPRLRERPGLFDDNAVINYLGRNMADLLIDAYRRLLEASPAGRRGGVDAPRVGTGVSHG